MKGKIKDHGIIVKFSEYSESSLIIRCLTSKHGLISILAKGLRKQPQKNTLLAMGEYEFTLYAPSDEGLYLFCEAALIKEHGFEYAPEIWTAAQCGTELIAAMIIPAYEHEMIYDYLRLYLDYLGGVKSNAILVFWRFFTRLMQIIGVPFSTSKCMICHAEDTKIIASAAATADLVCADCYYESADKERYLLLASQSAGILALLPQIGNYLNLLHIERGTVRQINAILLVYYQAHFHKKLKLNSLSVLEQFYG
ncbi:MAG: DNA repair protein RecO [Candidatus Cloacimonadaceae bacterium]|nr:DNA repair protein RecO [Candidatus Cloacimonadaceae bacterium]MDP3114328.1 DNA repair protein RecO [Candidatus Cloacimonadaceae bacterium]